MIVTSALRSSPVSHAASPSANANNRGDVVLPAAFDRLPTLTLDQLPEAPAPPQPAPPAGRGGPAPPAGPFDGVYVSATRENASGDVILKLVNVQAVAQTVRIVLEGAPAVRKEAAGELLTGALGGINTVAEPMKIAPKPFAIHDAGPTFSHELPAHSVSVIRLKTH